MLLHHQEHKDSDVSPAKQSVHDGEGNQVAFVVTPDVLFEVLAGEIVDEGGEVEFVGEGREEVEVYGPRPNRKADVDWVGTEVQVRQRLISSSMYSCQESSRRRCRRRCITNS